MNERAMGLAKRLVGHERWEWMGGMSARNGDGYWFRVVVHDQQSGPWLRVEGDRHGNIDTRRLCGWVPDIDDPATVGCLRAMVAKLDANTPCGCCGELGIFATGEDFAQWLLHAWDEEVRPASHMGGGVAG
jgi:hypothetical protein